ncbi:TetR/AcrR family transcriptional regulator [Roseobacter weihaiensis]|uniref:TetR/AcrR family transcriptional regulator n=1 Tax=Roseobacter weihaiensis TaxID=2763262 RepID=UPI001D0A9CB0|nr:TetR family transcriptional regulator C-terminal domain-containing protein [Roseobacter sp. H9]
MNDSSKMDVNADGKTRLVQGAIDCVAENGIAGSSVRRIAEYAGVTPGLVRHHFGNKNKLLAECYRSLNTLALSRMSKSMMSENRSLADDLMRTLKAFFPEDLRDVHQMRVLVAFWGAVLTTAEFAEVQAETNLGFHRHLTDMMRFHLGDRKDLPVLADAVQAVIDGLWLECCMNPSRMSPEGAIKRAHQFCLLALNQPGQN